MKEHANPHSFDYYVLLFFLLAFVGWLWEVLLFLAMDHAFINRGVYRGPYLPVYGAGGLLLCFLLRRLQKKPAVVMLLSMGICSALEYATGFFLEMLWGIRWWDYSGHFMNLHGRICLAGALLFGLSGVLLICFFLPMYEKWYQKIPVAWRMGLMLGLMAVFVLDATYAAVNPNTGEGITWTAESDASF